MKELRLAYEVLLTHTIPKFAKFLDSHIILLSKVSYSILEVSNQPRSRS